MGVDLLFEKGSYSALFGCLCDKPEAQHYDRPNLPVTTLCQIVVLVLFVQKFQKSLCIQNCKPSPITSSWSSSNTEEVFKSQFYRLGGLSSFNSYDDVSLYGMKGPVGVIVGLLSSFSVLASSTQSQILPIISRVTVSAPWPVLSICSIFGETGVRDLRDRLYLCNG